MTQGKLSTVFNLSSQGNLLSVQNSVLEQYNYFVGIGFGYLNCDARGINSIPITIKIDKAGELEINGLDELDENNIRISADKKVTSSEDDFK